MKGPIWEWSLGVPGDWLFVCFFRWKVNPNQGVKSTKPILSHGTNFFRFAPWVEEGVHSLTPPPGRKSLVAGGGLVRAGRAIQEALLKSARAKAAAAKQAAEHPARAALPGGGGGAGDSGAFKAAVVSAWMFAGDQWLVPLMMASQCQCQITK